MAFGVFLGRSLLELEPAEPLVADDPGVVAGLDDVRVTRADLHFGSVLVLDRDSTGVGDADYFQRRDPQRATKRRVAKLEGLGHHVTLSPANA